MPGHTPWAAIKREATGRPDPGPAYPGYEYVAQPDPDFELGGAGKRCRGGWKARRCRNDAVATLFRPVGGPGRHPWRYCADHLFGRWIEGDVVMEWVKRGIA